MVGQLWLWVTLSQAMRSGFPGVQSQICFLLFRHSFVAFRGFVALLSSSHSSSLWHCQEFYVFPLSIFQGFCQHFWLVETSIWFKTLTKCCCSSSCFKKRHSGRHFDKLNWNFVCLVEHSRKEWIFAFHSDCFPFELLYNNKYRNIWVHRLPDGKGCFNI